MSSDNNSPGANKQPSATRKQGALTAKDLVAEFNVKLRPLRCLLRRHYGTWQYHAWGSDWQFQSEKDKRAVRRLIAKVLEARRTRR